MKKDKSYLNSHFKQWKFVQFRFKIDKVHFKDIIKGIKGFKVINGLIISKDSRTILWEDGLLTNYLGYGFYKGKPFKLDKVLSSTKNDSTYYIDNLTFIEILNNYNEHLKSLKKKD